ncbi:SDR family oxidoreductase [Oryzobacter telluris]|uniref:SDR family oxidoreductase n=1 Tax=Oryzobacter telluris TaxID=3149179 RepID=UPI00370DD4EE
MSRVVVLGGTGAMGALVAGRLEAAGHEVVRAARSTGVDVSTGAGLDAVVAGADVVVDCLNRTTLSKAVAVGFFEGAARRVVAAAEKAGVGHLVVLSIVNVTDPAVRRSTGYYAGKAAQEDAYRAGSVPLTVVRTTAWFTLAETFLGQIRVGRVALVPRMRLRPVHPDAAAALLVDAVGRGPGTPLLELAGPEELDASSMARAVAGARHQGVRVVGIPVPLRGLRSGLLPGPGATVDDRTFGAWLSP